MGSNKKTEILDVPRHVQLSGKLTGSCGFSSVQQVLSYYGCFKSIEEILAESICDKGGGAFDGELGRYALRQGFSTVISTYDCNAFDPSWFDLSNEDLIEKIEKTLKYKKRKYGVLSEDVDFYSGYLNFLKEGGEMNFAPVSKKMIREYIDQGIPLIASIYYELFHGQPRSFRSFLDHDIYGEINTHAVVVSGYSGTEVHITDSSDDDFLPEDGKYWYEEDSFMANCNQAGGTMIIIKPKK